MRAYIPFGDGSAVSYDGKQFTIHRRPIDIDADLSALSESIAAQLWRERREEVIRALEAVWWREYRQRREKEMKRVYSKEKEEVERV
ncbi:MAG: hypothetical protein LBD04_07360 [Synergistaceae bacterium]|jgi:hypothetical protein|nr:hypothetical protein [Synergistaceae bacterium]